MTTTVPTRPIGPSVDASVGAAYARGTDRRGLRSEDLATTRRPPVHAASGPVRLTRRGRCVVVLLLLGALLTVAYTVGRAGQSHAAGPARVTVVQSGDTLWSIAARVAPDRDTRQVVAQISAANHLSSASLQVGERLIVPA